MASNQRPKRARLKWVNKGLDKKPHTSAYKGKKPRKPKGKPRITSSPFPLETFYGRSKNSVVSTSGSVTNEPPAWTGIKPGTYSAQSEVIGLRATHFRSGKTTSKYEIKYVPGYRPVRWLLPTGYNRRYEEEEALPVSVSHAGRGLVEGTFVTNVAQIQSHWTIPLVHGQIGPSDKQLHFMKFNEKIRSRASDLSIMALESKETVKMLTSAVRDTAALYKAAKKGNLKAARKIFNMRGIKRKIKDKWRNKAAESRWLELQYGWQPTIMDIKAGMKWFSENQSLPPIYKVTHSTMKTISKEQNEKFKSLTGTSIYKTSCYYAVENSKLRTASQWGLTNPLHTAWDFIPYSFVVDWFVPVGDFLNQLDTTTGLKFISGTSVEHTEYRGIVEYETSLNAVGPIGGYVTSTPYRQPVQYSLMSTTREVHLTTPIGLPVFDFFPSIGKALNAIALISQRR